MYLLYLARIEPIHEAITGDALAFGSCFKLFKESRMNY
jgi:hypothetical protein